MAIIKATNQTRPTCLDIELAVARYFNYRENLIVPNVFWGLGFRHELDVAVMSPAGYLTEVEIKTSIADLRRDKLKTHGHRSPKIRRHFFAVPDDLKSVCREVAADDWGILSYTDHGIEVVRPAKIDKAARPLSDKEKQKLYELAAMRIWTLKRTLCDRIDRAKYMEAMHDAKPAISEEAGC